MRKILPHVPMLLTGAVLAFVVALIFRLVPDDFPTHATGRVVLFVIGLATAPGFIVFCRKWEKIIHRPHVMNSSIATIGALTFDSIATGFAPQLYGHTGVASTTVFASIVFGGICIVVCDYLSTERK